MSPERWKQIEDLYHAALERDAAARGAFLAEASRTDEELRREVESLLAQDTGQSPLGRPVWEGAEAQLVSPGAPLGPGSQLGPYRIEGRLGEGGMGVVYRARDPRIGRDVAVKVLHADVATDADRLRRFKQEMKAAGSLNHPNILAIYDVGAEDSSPYIVSELLHGKTLRDHLTSRDIGRRKAIEYAIAMARGLAAAHEKSVIHRDFKPENIFITNDGGVKILDFGLAKLTHPEPSGGSADSTVTQATETGVVMGTVGYMAPEQARGDVVDHRADIFCFGCILYEMISGQRAFKRESMPETLAAILKDDPPPLADAELDRIVRHCLEKNPRERFNSALDLAFALEAIAGQATVTVAPQRAPGRRVLLAAGAAVILGAGLFLLGQHWERSRISPPMFHQLTFRRGSISSARFAPDGHTIVYGANWDGRAVQLYSMRPESPESSPLPLPGADILSISGAGDMALSLNHQNSGWVGYGTLARAPMAGGAARELLEMIQEAAWNRDGSALAVVRAEIPGGGARLEYPAGKVLYQTGGWLSHPRFSADGDVIAFAEHPVKGDNKGHVALVDLRGEKRDLTGDYPGGLVGVAWAPDGDEVWYTAGDTGNFVLRAVSRRGAASRIVLRVPGSVTLQDIAGDGRVLLTRDMERPSVMVRTADSDRERDLAWLDCSSVRDFSPDGARVFITEACEGARTEGAYLRKTDGSPAVRIGEGYAFGLSPDGKWALSVLSNPPAQLLLNPTGAGESRVLPRGPIERYGGFTSDWFADSRRVVFAALEPGREPKLYVQDVQGGEPRAISGEGLNLKYGRALSPDQKYVAAIDTTDRKIRIVPVDGGPPRPAPGVEPGELSAGWTKDGHFLYVYSPDATPPTKVFVVDVSNGQRKVWKEIMPSDPAGTHGIDALAVNPDGKAYVYNLGRTLSDLFVVDGLK
jgi:serine/threonine protein kinase/Tol biopolymer transport system component